MCPAIGKVVSNFQLVAPSVKTSPCNWGSCSGANVENGEAGGFCRRGGTETLPVGRFLQPLAVACGQRAMKPALQLFA